MSCVTSPSGTIYVRIRKPRAYEEEKHRARDLHPDDSHAYADEKAPWIRGAEAKALVWFDEQRSRVGNS